MYLRDTHKALQIFAYHFSFQLESWSQHNDDIDTQQVDRRLRMSDMMKGLNMPVNKLVKQQIAQFEDSQEMERIRLHAKTQISDLTIKVSFI